MQSDANSFAAEWSATPEHVVVSRHQIARWLHGISLEPDRAQDILLALSEAVTNAMEHGCRFDVTQLVSLQATLHGEFLTVTVNDRGCWIEPANQPWAPGQQRGRGLLLINEIADYVDIAGSAQGTQIIMRFEAAEQIESPANESCCTDQALTPGVPRDDEHRDAQPAPESIAARPAGLA